MPSTTTHTVTREWLRDHGACRDEIARFATLWPNGAPVTRSTLVEAAAHGFNLGWLARELLDPPALAEYERVRALAWAEYERVRAPAWAEYERVSALALADALGLED